MGNGWQGASAAMTHGCCTSGRRRGTVSDGLELASHMRAASVQASAVKYIPAPQVVVVGCDEGAEQ
eukprot:3048714-Pyramimonas_sp.AAC.1